MVKRRPKMAKMRREMAKRAEMPPGADNGCIGYIYIHISKSSSNHYWILDMGDRACLATWYAL